MHSRVANDERDRAVYHAVLICRARGLSKRAAWAAAQKILKSQGIFYSDDSTAARGGNEHIGVRKAFARGEMLERGELKRKKVGRPGRSKIDIVQRIVDQQIYEHVDDLIKKGLPKAAAYRETCRLLSGSIGFDKPLTTGFVRFVYERGPYMGPPLHQEPPTPDLNNVECELLFDPATGRWTEKA